MEHCIKDQHEDVEASINVLINCTTIKKEPSIEILTSTIPRTSAHLLQ